MPRGDLRFREMNPADGVVESSTRPGVAAVGLERRRVQVALRSQSQRTLCLMEGVGERSQGSPRFLSLASETKRIYYQM